MGGAAGPATGWPTTPPAPAPSDRRRRVSNVDVLRAAAAVGVLAIHAYALGGREVPVRAQHVYEVPLLTLATGVWLFFAISGYVIGRPFVDRLLSGGSLPPLGPYARRRAARILPLYWAALTALIALGGATGTHGWQFPLHYLLLNDLVPGRQEALFPAAWTLTLEALFYAALPALAHLVAAVSRRRSRGGRMTARGMARLILISWALSLAFTVGADLLGDGRIGLWLRGSLPAMWQMFCPGLLLAVLPWLTRGAPGRSGRDGRVSRPGQPDPRWPRLLELPARPRRCAAVAVAFLIPGAILGAAAPLRFGVVSYQLLTDASRPLFAIGYGLLVALALAAAPWRPAWPVALGLASYGIYLLHPVVASLLQRLGLIPPARDPLVAFAANTALLALLTIPLALASWRWLERPLLERAVGARR